MNDYEYSRTHIAGGFYLQHPGMIIQVDGKTPREVATEALGLLCDGADWVIYGRLRQGKLCQWTAMERDAAGNPTQIGYTDHRGEFGVITNPVL